MSALNEIADERRRQIEVEGFDAQHDEMHGPATLVAAARCYIRGEKIGWPWEDEWWKPKGRRRDMVRGGALAMAALDRITAGGIGPDAEARRLLDEAAGTIAVMDQHGPASWWRP